MISSFLNRKFRQRLRKGIRSEEVKQVNYSSKTTFSFIAHSLPGGAMIAPGGFASLRDDRH
jgi:hypothetical protein